MLVSSYGANVLWSLDTVCLDRPFAEYDHMVENLLCWMANCALGHPQHSNLNLLCFQCPSVQFAMQYGGFCTMITIFCKGHILARKWHKPLQIAVFENIQESVCSSCFKVMTLWLPQLNHPYSVHCILH